MSAACLLCGGETRAVLEGVRDTRFGVPGDVDDPPLRALRAGADQSGAVGDGAESALREATTISRA